jgi:hypothetical protein
VVARPQRANVTLWAHDGIAPLEVWDVIVGGRSLFAQREEPTFYASLAAAVVALRRGDARREGGERLAPASFQSIAIVGGALDEARARAAFEAARLTLDVVATDPCFAASSAVDALRLHGGVDDVGGTVVVDVGQTAVKAVGSRGKSHRPRRDGGAGRTELVCAVAEALAEAAGSHAPSFVLLGLPCEVELRDGRLVLGSSTYPTAGEGVALVEEILVRAGLAGVPAAVVNDAVLAAWAIAQTSPSPSSSRLVLTVGLGVGAALAGAP